MTPLLKELLLKSSIEDILLSERGLFYFEKNTWHGPLKDEICEEKNLFILSRRIADKANITLGLTQPTADSFIDFEGTELFRAHIVVPPMSMQGTEITLRRLPKKESYSFEDFTRDNTLIGNLKKSVWEKKSILVAGATGAGKSSLLTAFMNEIPSTDRVLILEDSPELSVPNKLSTKLLARSDRFGFREGAQWDLSHLVFESLRMRPDRIIVGECRGPEARGIYQALMTGHRGVMTSLHAGTCSEAIKRFNDLVQAASKGINPEASHAWDLVLHVQLNVEGQREIDEVKFFT
jgi:pilus assembly protein CpaF